MALAQSPKDADALSQLSPARIAGDLREGHGGGFSGDSCCCLTTQRPSTASRQGSEDGKQILSRLTALEMALSPTGSSQGLPDPCNSSKVAHCWSHIKCSRVQPR